MNVIQASGAAVLFDPPEMETALFIAEIINESSPVIQGWCSLPPPRNCRVMVMTSWFRFFWQSAPILWRPLILLTPLYFRVYRRQWKLVAGWTMCYRGAPTIGIKPQRMWIVDENSIGRRMFIQGVSDLDKMRNIICHEMAHAYTAHLKLPLWLNEGVAMTCVDAFLGRETVRPETLRLMADAATRHKMQDYNRLHTMNDDAILYGYVRGYWITRYLREKHPKLVTRLLATRRSKKQIDKEVATVLDVPLKKLWSEIDGTVACHFEVSNSYEHEEVAVAPNA